MTDQETTSTSTSTSTEPLPLTIVSLTVSNVKRIRALTIRPDGAVVKLGGRNAQGKSSTLDAIEMALGGAGAIPPEPLRHGTRKGSVTLDLGDFVVERKFSQGGDPTLVVRNREGVPQKSPQFLLDSFCSRVAFDPLEFSRMDPPKQDLILKQLLGIDFAPLDAERQAEFAARTDEKRALKEGEVQFNAMTEYRGLPANETSAVQVAKELADAREGNHARERARGIEDRLRETVARANRDVVKLEAQLEAAKVEALAQAELLTAAQAATVQLGGVVDTAFLEAKLATTEQTNAHIRWNRERAAKGAALTKLEQSIAKHTEAIEAIDQEKAATLAAADFPVPGLGFDDAGPTLNGIPFEQASSAEKTLVSTTIGFRLNPRLKIILIREGSLLDSESLAAVARIAESEHGQVWLEQVGDDGTGSQFIIEDGGLKEPAAAE
jgi:hypothetical protein